VGERPARAGDKDFLTVIAAKLRFRESTGVSTVFLSQERARSRPRFYGIGEGLRAANVIAAVRRRL